MRYFNTRTLSLAALGLFAYISLYYSYGASYASPGDRTNSPMGGYATCSSTSGCHTSPGVFTPVTTVQLLSGSTPVTSYTSSTSYTLRITMTSSTGITSSTRYGFQVVAVQSSTNNAVNTWGSSLPSGTHSRAVSGRNYIEQSSQLSSNIIDIPWTSPNISTGNITFYAMGNIVNNNYQETGDNCAGTTLTITPAGSGCVAPTLGTSVTDIICKGDSTGAVNLSVTGGTSPFLYNWTGPNGYQATSQNISNLKAGVYNLLVTATGGCTTNTSATVHEPLTAVSVTATSNSPLCAGASLSLSGSANGGTGTLTPSWTGPNSFTSSLYSALLTGATPSMSGNYILTVHDANNCTAKDTANVVINLLPKADSINAASTDGYHYTFGIYNPQYVTTQKWDFGNGHTDTAANPAYAYTASGTYNVRLIVSNNCGSDTLYRQITATVSGAFAGYISGNNNGIKIYPNPAANFTRIDCPAGLKMYTVSVFDMRGVKLRDVQLQDPNTAELNTSGLHTGVYMVHITTGKGTVMIPLLINR